MENGSSNWIDFWIAMTDVAETLLWCLLVGTIVIRYRVPLGNVIRSISSRVEKGDSVDIFGLKIEAVQEAARTEALVEESIRETIESSLAAQYPESDSEGLSEKIIGRLRERNNLTIDFSAVKRSGPPRQSVPYDKFESVGLLLRYIWIEAGVFPKHSYGRDWIIRNDRTGDDLTEVGSRFARRMLGSQWDERPLSEVGIHVGDTVSVRRVS